MSDLESALHSRSSLFSLTTRIVRRSSTAHENGHWVQRRGRHQHCARQSREPGERSSTQSAETAAATALRSQQEALNMAQASSSSATNIDWGEVAQRLVFKGVE